ncbi:MAG: carboxypeptidase M32 [Myxococcales bacterium FL481]|nr:MAG: carboxypeptidase M32 [Myxococcales bacterium FL481]
MSYRQLTDHYRRIAHIQHVAAVTAWDEAVNMPPGGEAARGQAMATVAVLLHELQTDARLEGWLQSADQEALGTWERANLVQIRRALRRATAVAPDLVQALSLATSRCEQAWRKLRPTNDWETFAPLLDEVIARTREVAQALGERLGVDPYDALVDEHEPGMTAAKIDPIFAELASFLPDYIQRGCERQTGVDVLPLQGPFSPAAQRDLGLQLMRACGFDFNHGRLDRSHHPFCGGTPTDVRITTRYDETDFLPALMGVLHETGHAKYEQGLPRGWLEQPVGHALGMAMHESQSLLAEMQLCRSAAFWRFAGPLVRQAFGTSDALSDRNLAALATRVAPGKIRVDADELTYPCHVILRYEIEKELIAGTLTVADIPERWDEAMRDSLGIDTRGDVRDGCMQDVHWPAGAVGYFPTYTLGALIAAQLAAAMNEAIPDIDERLAQGDFAPMDAWLRQNVWSRGRVVSAQTALEQATGSELSVEPFRAHLARRYLHDGE